MTKIVIYTIKHKHTSIQPNIKYKKIEPKEHERI